MRHSRRHKVSLLTINPPCPPPTNDSLVYDPRSGSNEEDSEVLFCTFAEAAELNVADTRTVSDYIFATKLHNVMDSDDQDLRAFIDLDMAVIGRDRSGYLAYASQVPTQQRW